MANWFVGLPVPPGDWFSQVRFEPPSVRLFHPQDLHITVAFLGACGEERARAAFRTGRQWPIQGFTVALGRVQPFGNPKRLSALSASLAEPNERLEEAILEVRDGMTHAAQAKREHRHPRPHVTVARVHRKATPAEQQRALAWMDALHVGTPTVELGPLSLYTWAANRRHRQFQIVDSL